MKKIFIIATCFFICFPTFTKAQTLEEGAFYEDVLLSDDVKIKEESTTAKEQASEILKQKPKIIKIDGAPVQFRSSRPQTIKTSTIYGEAPFGLSWGATYDQIKALGVQMQKVTREDSVNDFMITQLPKPLSDFRQVIISFGENNSLWRINAYGDLIDDDASASKVLRLYRKYYKLLEQKYGNAQEFFTPQIITVEKTVKDEYGKDKIEIEKISEPMGGPNFLDALQSGEAVLYATFENQEVGAALAVNVDGEKKSYIVIDYTNLRIFRKREETALDAL